MRWIRRWCHAGANGEAKRRPRARPAQVSWAQLASGLLALALTAAAGFCFTKAITTDTRQWWLWGEAGAVSLALGSLVLLAALYGRVPLLEMTVVPRPALRSLPAERRSPVPLLGELLVEDEKLITEQQLRTALEWQERNGGKLGQALVDLGVLTAADLEQVLKRQVGLADPWQQP